MQLAADRAAPAIDADGFAAAMAAFAPFETPPRLAVAVSGGPDSTALALLADAWARARGGDVLALIVDHRLRTESAKEAARVADRLARRGIAGEILVWHRGEGDKHSQAAAREARYALLHAACARHDRRHLLVGHSRDDQAETVLLRLQRGSGIDGLAGMTALREDRGLRLLRPLLAFPKSALIATCRAQGVAWEDDPSNRSPAYARGALRARWPALAADGLTPETLLDTAARAGAARIARDRATAALLDQAAILHPEGWAELNRDALRTAPGEIVDRALARVLRSVGGAGYGPRREALARLAAAMLAPTAPTAARTLAGCRVLPRGDGRRLVVGREIAAAERRRCRAEETATTILWDRRFRVELAVPAALLDGATLGPLGAAPAPRPLSPALARLPAVARHGLPALWRDGALLALPACDGTADDRAHPLPGLLRVAFDPDQPLRPPPFVAAAAIRWLSMDPAALSR